MKSPFLGKNDEFNSKLALPYAPCPECSLKFFNPVFFGKKSEKFFSKSIAIFFQNIYNKNIAYECRLPGKCTHLAFIIYDIVL